MIDISQCYVILEEDKSLITDHQNLQNIEGK